MKKVAVKLIPIRHNGQVYQKGEPFEVDDKEYERIKAHVELLEEVESSDETLDLNKPPEKMTVLELKAYAKQKDIDLGEATKKEEILAVITKAGSGE